MKRWVLLRGCAVALLLLLPYLCYGQEYLLYEPKSSTAEAGPAAGGKGVLVKSVTVQRGDTLKRIARRYIGKDWLFPQVLLFNKLDNPDLIHPGDRLYVPVSKETAARERHPAKVAARPSKKRGHHRDAAKAGAEAAGGKEKAAAAAGRKPGARARRTLRKNIAEGGKLPPRPQRAGEGQALFQSARTAYIQGQYRKAADLFTQYLRSHSDSLVAADAALYRADCYLHLSEQ